MLQLSGVTKWFGTFRALDRVDFSVAAGEVVALIGANGAGKSTLMNVLSGLYPDAEYSGRLDGEVLDFSSPAAALKAGIGVVHQEIELVPNFTIAENMLLGAEPSGRYPFGIRLLRRRELVPRAKKILHDIGLAELDPKRKVGDMSIEARQIVQIAKVLALESRVVVFDEPTARLTSSGRDRLFALIRRLRDAGKMVVFISHYLEEVFEIADRVVVLRDGAVAADKPIAGLDIAALVKLMLGEVANGPPAEDVAFGDIVLQVRDLNCEPHFRNVNFDLRTSEILGIAGVIGSGRHEMVRSLIGDSGVAGSIMVTGHEIARRSTWRIVGRYFGFVPEDRKRDGIIPDLSVAANLGLPWLRELSTAGVVRGREVRRRASRLIGRLRLTCSSALQPVGELSGGNQQKAVLGRWFGTNAPVVLLEQPTVGVDVAGKEAIRQLVRSLAESGRAVVISTDDLWELEQMTDRILVMVRGEISTEFTTRSMRSADLVASLVGAKTAS
jgi:ABC-type sugar transport system ATPase subunit